jgi:lipid A 4'-phosphatase
MSPAAGAWWRTVALLCAAGFGLLALFAAAPWLDLRAAALFGGPEGFPLGGARAVEATRAVYHAVFVAFCVAAAVGLGARLAAPAGSRVPAPLWAYAAGVAALGPGVLANLVFKARWGRARPEAVAEFGGDRAFTGPFEIADQCAANCSFVSGEGSAAATVAAVALGLFWPETRAARAAALASAALWLGGAVWMRLAPGEHFLSDSLFAFVLVGLVAAGLHAALGVGARRRAVAPADNARALAAAARALAGQARAAAGRGLVRIVRQGRPSTSQDGP